MFRLLPVVGITVLWCFGGYRRIRLALRPYVVQFLRVRGTRCSISLMVTSENIEGLICRLAVLEVLIFSNVMTYVAECYLPT